MSQDGGMLMLTPELNGAESVADVTLDTEVNAVEGINEYGFGLWSRWTQAFPTRLIAK